MDLSGLLPASHWFESAHHSLVATLTGAVNHLRQLVERYLVTKSLLNSKVQKDGLSELTTELICGVKLVGKGLVRPTTAMRNLLISDYSVTAREIVDGKAFDSACDSKSHSNSFITFRDVDNQVLLGQILALFRDVNQCCLGQLLKVVQFTCSGATDVPCFFFRSINNGGRLLC